MRGSRKLCFNHSSVCHPLLSCLQVLKEEGNRLFSQGRYAEAAAKYEKVKSELTGDCRALGPHKAFSRTQHTVALCQHPRDHSDHVSVQVNPARKRQC